MATDASAFVPSPTLKSSRKKSVYEEEDIIVKPSTELIPDEYEHLKNESVLFHVFRTATDPEEVLAEELVECVKAININADNQKSIHNLTTESEIREKLEEVKKESLNKSALILVFLGYIGNSDGTVLLQEPDDKGGSKSIHVKEIWNYFISNNCPELKDKPKIFIFCTSKQPRRGSIQTDSVRHRTMNFDKVYDFPCESDLLIVYKKIDDEYSTAKINFINQLCYNIMNYSKKYDIIDLISHINLQSTNICPLIISTLTRKFYLTPSDERDHYLSVTENNSYLEEILKKLQGDLRKLQESQKKKKEKLFRFSFKKKSEDKPQIAQKSTVVSDHAKPLSKWPKAGSSTHKKPFTTVAPKKRVKNTSESEANPKIKEPWRY